MFIAVLPITLHLFVRNADKHRGFEDEGCFLVIFCIYLYIRHLRWRDEGTISRFFDRLIHLIGLDLLFFCNKISESLPISNYTQQIDTCRNALQRKRGLSSAYLLCLSKQTAAYLIEFDVSQTTTGN